MGFDSTTTPGVSPQDLFIPGSYRGERAAEWSW
jgi:hypothetical protein